MKAVLAALAFAGALAALSLGSPATVDPEPVGSIARSGAFELSRNGGMEKCWIQRVPSQVMQDEIAHYGCAQLLPAFEQKLYWSDRDDGDIAFVTADGHEVVAFGPADGDGFESYAPRKPLLSLIERR